VDFTDVGLANFGTEAQRFDGVVKMLWLGNASGDGILKYSGANNDRDRILLRVGGNIPTATVSGYFVEDVNMDGLVKYAGSVNDRDLILVNIGGNVPTATKIEQLP